MTDTLTTPRSSFRTESRKMSCYAGWLPSSPVVYESYLNKHHDETITKNQKRAGHVASVKRFEEAIKADLYMVKLFKLVFRQQPHVPNVHRIKDFEELLYLMDGIVTKAPAFHIAKKDNGDPIGEPVGVPLYLLFDLLGNTGAAYDLFRMPAFNAAMKDLLCSWGEHLITPESSNVLHEGSEGWFSPIALRSLEEKNRGKFEDTYVCPNPSAFDRGFPSWDAFFVREFQSHARPVQEPHNPKAIHNACESTFLAITRNVKADDRFWLKSCTYSLYDIFDQDETHLDRFVGGTVYQAFLSPQDYHRWHSPITGTVTRIQLVDGTYYAAFPDAGAPDDDEDYKPGDPHGALVRSQRWLTMSSARALVFIEADNPDIGFVCFIAVGMGEISTCAVTVKEGQRVTTGQQLGMFHFGGSSHALIFGPQAKLTFEREREGGVSEDHEHRLINTVLARIE